MPDAVSFSSTQNGDKAKPTGPLHGMRVVEFAALGPAPMAAMLLADMGAEVVRIARKAPAGRPVAELFDPALDILNRSRLLKTHRPAHFRFNIWQTCIQQRFCAIQSLNRFGI